MNNSNVEWKVLQSSKSDRLYYYNIKTKQSQWNKPDNYDKDESEDNEDESEDNEDDQEKSEDEEEESGEEDESKDDEESEDDDGDENRPEGFDKGFSFHILLHKEKGKRKKGKKKKLYKRKKQ